MDRSIGIGGVLGPEPCECGRSFDVPGIGEEADLRELACRCGRLVELEFVRNRWRLAVALNPEGSVPISGFSMRLRQEPDVQRFWFRHALSPTGYLIVHIVFSPSSGEAEVKAADLKAASFLDVRSAAEARRRWVDVERSRIRPARTARRRFVYAPTGGV